MFLIVSPSFSSYFPLPIPFDMSSPLCMLFLIFKWFIFRLYNPVTTYNIQYIFHLPYSSPNEPICTWRASHHISNNNTDAWTGRNFENFCFRTQYRRSPMFSDFSGASEPNPWKLAFLSVRSIGGKMPTQLQFLLI